MKDAENALKGTLNATPECLAFERLSEALTERERQHVERCSRCQTELQLWREFDRAEPSPDEGAAVQWIVAELARRNRPMSARATTQRLGWLTPVARRWAAAVGSVVVVATVGYLTWDREPAIRNRARADETYRTGQLRVVGSVGDLLTPPEAFEWVAPGDAVSYDVEILEVDGTLLWRATSSAPRIDLPPSVVRQLLPGKTLLWEIRARNVANNVIAESGKQRFRVEVAK